MQRLIVTCACGERIQVPRSALGRTGLCPACERPVAITSQNAMPARTQATVIPAPAPASWPDGRGSSSPTEDAKRRFAEAVDLYFKQRYAEALTVFETLAGSFPGNEDIERGRGLCINALRRTQTLALEHQVTPQAQTPPPPPPPPPSQPPRAWHEAAQEQTLRHTTNAAPARQSVEQQAPESLDLDALKRLLVDKMAHGTTDDIQLRAAELAARVFGYVDADTKKRDVDELQSLLESGDGVAYVALLTVIRRPGNANDSRDGRRSRPQ